MQRRYYLLWLLAATFMAIGAAVDTSYHFAHLFDEFSVPHLMLAAGITTNGALLLWALIHERDRVRGLERSALLLAAVGSAIFIVAIPLDLLWHLTFGIDITTWSPTHLLLNYSSAVTHIGIICAWLASPSARQARGWLVTFTIGMMTLLAAHYPLYQQEYATVAIDSLLRTGKAPWAIDPDMWVLASPNAVVLAKGGAPDWLYIVYSAVVAGYALGLSATLLYSRRRARRAQGDGSAWPWPIYGAATTIATFFVLVRVIFHAAFLLIGQPAAVTPWWLIPFGVAVDLVWAVAASGWAQRTFPALARDASNVAARNATVAIAAIGGAAGALAFYGCAEALRAAHQLVPVLPAGAVPFAMATGALAATLGALLGTYLMRITSAEARDAGTPAPVTLFRRLVGATQAGPQRG